jgi:hypothetical protein
MSVESISTQFGLQGVETSQLMILNEVTRKNAKKDASTAGALIKAITGGDLIHIDRKYSTVKQRAINGKIMVVGNNMPEFPNDGGAISRRMLLLPMTHVVADMDMGTEGHSWKDKVLSEMSGIFTWACEGAKDLINSPSPGALMTEMMDEASKDLLKVSKEPEGNAVETALAELFEVTMGEEFLYSSEIVEAIKQKLEGQGTAMIEWSEASIMANVGMWAERFNLKRVRRRSLNSSGKWIQKRGYLGVALKDASPSLGFKDGEF